MKFAKLTIVCGIIFLLSACASEPAATTQVISDRYNHAIAQPNWVDAAEPVKMESTQMSSVGFADIPESYSVENGFESAERSAKKGIAQELQKRLRATSSVNSEQADVVSDKTIKFSAAKIQRSDKYWEKVVNHAEGGSLAEEKGFYKVYVLVTLSKADLQEAMSLAIASAAREEMPNKFPEVKINQVLVDSKLKPKNDNAPVVAGATELKSTLTAAPAAEAQPVVATVASAIKPVTTVVATVVAQKATEASVSQTVVAPVERKVASVTGAFAVQVYAFSKEARAKRVTAALKGKGLEAFYISADINGHTVYRVVVGHYATHNDASAATIDVLKQSGSEAALVRHID
jgi:DedD protein